MADDDDYAALAEAPPCCPECGGMALSKVLKAKDTVIADYERELRSKRALITKLRRENLEEAQADPIYKDARQVFDYWKAKLAPKAREFNGERLACVLARLRAGADTGELKEAIDGAAARPYISERGARASTGRPDQRNVELQLICRSEAHVTRFRGYAAGAEGAAAPEPVSPPPSAPELRAGVPEPPPPVITARLGELRGWTPKAISRLGIGFDGERVIFPIRDAADRLVGLGRYAPNPKRRSGAKMLQDGSRDLFPSPESVTEGVVWLVEGEADATAMWSIGLPAIGVPGVSTWKAGWTARFAKFKRVLVCFDCDRQGREAAATRTAEFAKAGITATPIDLDDERGDGYDLSDLILERGEGAATVLIGLSVPPAAPVIPIRSEPAEPVDPRSPWERITEALEAHDCRVRMTGPGKAMANCPAHDDRTPSLSLMEGDEGTVVMHDHGGCETREIIAALGLDWTDLYTDSRRVV